MVRFIKHKIVEPCTLGVQGFFLTVFPTMKRVRWARGILNLRDFNEYLPHLHFKMESIKDVIHLIYPNCFVMTVDFKDAYFSVYIHPENRKWFQFLWNDQAFHFTCLPQGLTSAPRIFTKLLKPVLSHLRKL